MNAESVMAVLLHSEVVQHLLNVAEIFHLSRKRLAKIASFVRLISQFD
ncbi:hypothetical protein THOG05_70196 [Vibrio rotiferianus]|nr:hypothetical protein THOG05_70196 [Vibrio rotiferianus]